MNPLKKILVCLDLSDLDETLIKFASFIVDTGDVQKVIFVNIIRNFNIPEEVNKEFPRLLETAIVERKEKLKAVVDAYFTSKKEEVIFTYMVKQGIAAKKILKISKEKEVDLIIAGRKNKLVGTGVVTQRLARRASRNLLIIPEGSEPKLNKFLVPNDFSDYSKIAMEEAVSIASNMEEEVKIICQNVFTVPVGYSYTGKSYEEFASIMEHHAKIDFKKFIKEIDVKGLRIDEEYTLDRDDDPVNDIYHMALEKQVDAIIVGAKGRTATTAIFLGSMAERLIQLNAKVPMLVVRPKGKNAGIIDLIKEI